MRVVGALMIVLGLAYFWTVANAYQTTGMKYDHLAITYSCGSPELQQAVQAWADVSGLTDGGCSATPDIKATVVNPWPYSPNILGLAGYTATNFPGHSIIECTIQINPVAAHFLGVWVHEVGHCLWSGHSEVADAAMNQWCCNPIGPDDLAGVVAVYGAEPPPAILPRAVSAMVAYGG